MCGCLGEPGEQHIWVFEEGVVFEESLKIQTGKLTHTFFEYRVLFHEGSHIGQFLGHHVVVPKGTKKIENGVFTPLYDDLILNLIEHLLLHTVLSVGQFVQVLNKPFFLGLPFPPQILFNPIVIGGVIARIKVGH
jgi:hypothetical protein